VIRLRAPRAGETVVEDVVQGTVRWANDQLDDLILVRSDGAPTYMHAVVVDDHDMGVTHVIRGDDHLTNAARQSLIYAAMGWIAPRFAHIPLIHGSDGAKLSKRHGATGTTEYAAMGYLPEAMRNYLARLGWGHGLCAEIPPDRQPRCLIRVRVMPLWPRGIGQPIEESTEFDAPLGGSVAVAVAALLPQQRHRGGIGIGCQYRGSRHHDRRGKAGAADQASDRQQGCHHQRFSRHGAPVRHSASQHPATAIRPGCFPSGGTFISTSAQSGSFGVCRAFETSSSSRNVMPELSTT
jgi:hypothetical protein